MGNERSGRKTAREEVEAYLAGLGLDSGALARLEAGHITDVPPETFAAMRDSAAAVIWREFQGLQGYAKVQAFKAIAELARQAPDGGGDITPGREPTVAEVISGIPGLPVERRKQILTGHLERLEEERASVLLALDEGDDRVDHEGSGREEGRREEPLQAEGAAEAA